MASSLYQNTAPGRPPGPPPPGPPFRQSQPQQAPQPAPPGNYYNSSGYQSYPPYPAAGGAAGSAAPAPPYGNYAPPPAVGRGSAPGSAAQPPAQPPAPQRPSHAPGQHPPAFHPSSQAPPSAPLPSAQQQGQQPAGAHGRRAETEAERHERKKREYVARKVEDRRQREKALAAGQNHQRGSQAAPGKPGPSGPPRDPRADKRAQAVNDKIQENRLKRSSTFICKMRFRNELPDPVSQPKLLRMGNTRDQYTKYTITSLEKAHKYRLHVDPDLGVPLDLLDISAYNAPKVRPPLDPADAELLLDDEVMKKDLPMSLRKKDRPTDKGVAWLVKTQYISPISFDPAKQPLTEKQAKELREMKEGRKEFLETHNDREQQIQSIEESFEIAKQLPVHQTKPELKPVEILPLLPDFSRWGDQFVHMVFDNEITADAELFAKLGEDVRDKLEERAVVKSYSLPAIDESRPDEKFVAYMVPKVEELGKDLYSEEEEIGYTWVREYHWDVRAEDARNTYVFCFGQDDVRYVPLHTKLQLQKKKAREGRTEVENDFAIPSSVSVRYVPPTPEDEQQRAATKKNFVEGRGEASVDQTVRLKRGRSPLLETTPMKRSATGSRRPASNRHLSDEDDLSV